VPPKPLMTRGDIRQVTWGQLRRLRLAISAVTTRKSVTVGAYGWGRLGSLAPALLLLVPFACAQLPVLPLVWVDNNEATDRTLPGYELNLATQAWVTTAPMGCTFHIPYWTIGSPTGTGLQLAWKDVEACRTQTGQCSIVDIPPAIYSAVGGLVIPQTNSALASCSIILRSTMDSMLPQGQTVGSHGIQDNCFPSATDIGLNNPDLTGTNMYFACGPTNVAGVISGITTLSTNTATLAAITAGAAVQCVALANGYVAPGVPEAVDIGANQEIVSTVSAVNQTGMCGVFTKNHSALVSVRYDTGSFLLANGLLTSTANYNDLQFMWQVVGTGTNPSALSFCNASGIGVTPSCTTNIGPDHWLIEDMAASMNAGNTGANFVVDFGSEQATQESQLPTHNHLQRIWVHGDWTSPATGANSISAFVHLHCNTCSLMQSQLSEGLRPGAEGHGFSAGYGTNLKANHNWVEGISQAFICGGFVYPSPTIAGLVPCQDMEFRRNRFTYPYSWLGQSPIAAGTNPYWTRQFSLVRKNGFERKVGQRWIMTGNIFENVDNSGAQSGPNGSFKVTNSSSGQGTNYQSITTDQYDAANIYRDSCDAAQVLGRSNATTNGDGAAFGISRVLFQHDLFYQVSVNGPGCRGADHYGFNITSADVEWNGTITEDPTGTEATFTASCAPQITGNCPNGPLPLGFQQTSIAVGDLVQISGCTAQTGFNTPTITSGVHTYAGLGTPALSGTISNGSTVVFANTRVGPNTIDNSYSCQLSYVQGFPRWLVLNHITIVTDSPDPLSSDAAYTTGPTYARDNMIRDSIITGGGWTNPVIGEGTNAEQFNWDVTSLSADHLVFPTRLASNYTEYGNNSLYPDSAGCTGNGCNPPTTIYFPATSYCTGNTSNTSCVGFNGEMATSTLALTLPDYHQFALRGDSVFAAGGSSQASDGAEMGVNLQTLDDAQTANLFVCPYLCGSPGPYPDVPVPVVAPPTNLTVVVQ
jgi:stage V sporulation protein SpoVS